MFRSAPRGARACHRVTATAVNVARIRLEPEHSSIALVTGPTGFSDRLATVGHALGRDRDGAVRIEREPEPLIDYRFEQWDVPDAETFAVDLALLPALSVLAGRSDTGIAHGRVDPLGRVPLGAPDLSAASRGGEVDRSLLKLVGEAGRGLVRLGPGVRPDWLAAEIAASFPNTKVLVVGSTRRECDRAADACRRAGVEVRRLRSGGDVHAATAARVVVTTPVQAVKLALAGFELLVALDAAESLDAVYELDEGRVTPGELRLHRQAVAEADDPAAAEAQAAEVLGRARPCLRWFLPRRVGFLRADAFVTPNESHRLRRLFGFEEVYVLPDGREPPRIVPETATFRGGPAFGVDAPPEERVEEGVLGCDARDTFVADHVRRRVGSSSNVEGPKTLVAAGTVAQAVALSRKLRGWPIRLAAGADLEGLPEADRDWAGRFAVSSDGPRVVATAAAMKEVDPAGYDLVVRAYGGTGAVPWLTRPPGVLSGSGATVTLLDFVDAGDPVLRRQSHNRLSAYAEAGWFAAGVCPVTARAEAFVDELSRLTRSIGRSLQR